MFCLKTIKENKQLKKELCDLNKVLDQIKFAKYELNKSYNSQSEFLNSILITCDVKPYNALSKAILKDVLMEDGLVLSEQPKEGQLVLVHLNNGERDLVVFGYDWSPGYTVSFCLSYNGEITREHVNHAHYSLVSKFSQPTINQLRAFLFANNNNNNNNNIGII